MVMLFSTNQTILSIRMGTKKKRTLLNANGGMLSKLCLTIDILPAQMRIVARSPMSFHGMIRLGVFTALFLDIAYLGMFLRAI
jgi:hypothetical protein